MVNFIGQDCHQQWINWKLFLVAIRYQLVSVSTNMAGVLGMSVLENLVRPRGMESPVSRSACMSLDSSIASSCSSACDKDGLNCLCIGLLPTFHLDYARTVEVFDFYTNGIEQDLDEYDLYQINVRSSPTRSLDCSSATNQHRHGAFPTNRVTCVFCRNNGEPLSVYGSHVLKDTYGRVTCPILRRYTCPICGCSGDDAHTIKYCPMNANRVVIPNRRRWI